MEKKKAKEHLPGPTKKHIRANGKTTIAAGMGSKAVLGLASFTKVLGRMTYTPGKVFNRCRMETATRVVLRITNAMAKVSTFLRTETTTKETFKMITDVDGAEKSMKMVESTVVSGTMAGITARAFSSLEMAPLRTVASTRTTLRANED